MKKLKGIPFLYRYRFILGYIALLLVFFGLLSFLPMIAPGGVSSEEMSSVVESQKITHNFIADGQVLDLPYRLLQKVTTSIFGITLYSIKLPSIIIAVLTGLFLILLLNRWFKSDVAIVGSILTTLSVAFLFLAGFGTPNIMYIFWLAVILWLGSKIVGNKNTHPMLVISFAFCTAMSLYTPHLAYIALGIAFAGITHPHLRHSLKQLKFYQLIISILVFIMILAPLVISCVLNPTIITKLIFTENINAFISNIATAFAPFFSFISAYDSVYLAPLFGLATVALLIIGALASIGKLFTSRNTVVSLLIIYAIIVAGLNKNAAISIVIPIAILTTAGIESIIQKWHSLFPENPYAHILGTLPLVIVVVFIIVADLSHFIFGYHYAPAVANNFNNDITLISEKLSSGTILIISEEHPDYEFYKLLEKNNSLTIMQNIPSRNDLPIASLGEPLKDENLELKQIITSPKKLNSARLYIYEKITTEKQGS
ncbi:MAG: glycosyltransferase family 39 protein [Candidatus Saccharibacteria bacterium]|nr:glycosyltransferase family 39 protein [Candidatus Saccharibacteria bacterium]